MEAQNEKSELKKIIFLGAVAGNVFFILWILYNGINEDFQGTFIEKMSYITLMALLAVNTFLLLSKRKSK